MPRYLSCFSSPSPRESNSKINSNRRHEEDGLTNDVEDPVPVKPGCIFCDVSKEKGFNIVYEDDQLIAFKDRSPGAATHLLIIPRYHMVSTVKDLTPKHIPLLREMTNLGLRLTNPTKMGFHIPPFSSVHHLHLHVLVEPFNLSGKMKYPITGRSFQDNASRYSSRMTDDEVSERKKGFGWFVSVDQALGILYRGGRIGLGPG